MSALEVTSMSIKGQVVIPRAVRTDLGLKPGSKLMVMSDGDNILIKPLLAPKLAVFERLISESRAFAKRAGLKKSDVAAAIQKVRHAHRA
jgi:AbrB family looped-hinge helix DNA binding protein